MLDDLLMHFGYDPEDDSWETEGRRTYSNELDATKSFMNIFAIGLGRYGWKRDSKQLRRFNNEYNGQIIELEPGGSGITGHLLHHLKEEHVDDSA